MIFILFTLLISVLVFRFDSKFLSRFVGFTFGYLWVCVIMLFLGFVFCGSCCFGVVV